MEVGTLLCEVQEDMRIAIAVGERAEYSIVV